MGPNKLRFRQVHLDFHTSRDCQNVGAEFDSRTFAETVKMGHVDSMTIFAKCHHGFSYYPTKVGTTHPHLAFDLMGQQIEALHSVGVRAPIYVSLMWDDLAGEQHGEWVVVDKSGAMLMRSPGSGGRGWTTHDLTSGYGEYVIAQVQEICRNYPVDGLFFDICFPIANYSPWNQARLRQADVSLDDDQAVFQFAVQGLQEYRHRLSAVVRELVPDATIFFNGTITPVMGNTISFQTHLEIESLPTTSNWGYLHYPIMARQARTYGLDFLGMTGRFHKSWADFGGLKTQDQLDYECGVVVGAGGRISVGDQLHPRGVLDPAVYRLVGRSFERIERLEPWLKDTEPTAEVAILNHSKPVSGQSIPGHSDDVDGAAQLFLETAIQFDILDANLDTNGPTFSHYKALVLPDGFVVDAALKPKLEAFIAAGGKLVLSGTAALDTTNNNRGAAFDGVPVRYVAPAPTVPSYLRLDQQLVGETELAADYDYVFYEQAHQVQPIEGASAYGTLRRALFNRTWEHFTSHEHAPVGESLGTPLVVEKGNVLYFAAPFFSAYRNHDYWAYRALVQNVLRRFLPAPLLLVSGPGWVECTLHTQEASSEHAARQIVHIVAYHPRRTLQPIPHVDQSWATAGLSIKILARQEQSPRRVYLAPDEQPLHFAREGAYIRVDLPPVGAHTTLVLE